MRAQRTRSIAIGVAVLLTAACSSGSDASAPSAGGGSGSGEITVWGHQGQEGEVTALQKTIQDFNSSQSDIKATLKLIPEADYTKTVTATNAEDLPDVLEYDGPLMSSFVYSGKLSSVDGFVTAETVDNQTASVKTQNTYQDGKLYGVSMFDSGMGIYGNKKLLDAAGITVPTSPADAWTAEEFTDVLTTLAAADADQKVLDIKENYGGEWPAYGFMPVIYSAGAEIVKDNQATGNLDSAAAITAVETFASWRPYVDPNSDDKAFTAGRVALSWVGHWVYPDYSKALADDLVVMPLPNFGSGTKTGQGSWAWGIGAQSDNAKAGGAFLDFLVDDASVTAMTTANGAPPGTTSMTASSELYQDGGPLALFAEQLAMTCGDKGPSTDCVAESRPVTAAYPTISTQFSQAFFAAYNGGDAKAELEKAAKAIDLDFKDNDNYSD